MTEIVKHRAPVTTGLFGKFLYVSLFLPGTSEQPTITRTPWVLGLLPKPSDPFFYFAHQFTAPPIPACGKNSVKICRL